MQVKDEVILAVTNTRGKIALTHDAFTLASPCPQWPGRRHRLYMNINCFSFLVLLVDL